MSFNLKQPKVRVFLSEEIVSLYSLRKYSQRSIIKQGYDKKINTKSRKMDMETPRRL